jgi:hypothetical protein
MTESRPLLPALADFLRAVGLALCVLLLADCGMGGQEVMDGGPAFQVRDGTRASGIKFSQFNGMSGRRYLVETMGSGVCLLDYDGDDHLDIYFMQGAPTPGSPRPDPPPANALYHNLGGGRFQDVTARAGVGDTGQGQGCTVGDIEGDGDLDIYVVNFGANVLYRNNGDGTFTDYTQVAGVGNPQWGSSAAFADIDSDGDLDLYVANYVDFSYENHKSCGDQSRNLQFYCSPKAYKAEPDVLYRNDGSGRFTDVTRKAGLYNDSEGKGLGVTFADVDDDGDVDIYVANDSTRNFLYSNDGNGHFRDVTMLAGVGLSEAGRPQAGMGVGFGDYDNDQALDLVVTNLSNESNELYRNLGGGIFTDSTFRSGIGGPSMLLVGFGVAWLDLDADSDLDLFVANGHVLDNVKVLSDAITYAQRNQIYENRGGGRFREVSALSGSGLAMDEVSRGLAVGDLDGDGDLDLVLNGNGSRAVLLLNETDPAGNYLRLRLRRETGDRFAVGARVLLSAGAVSQVREVVTGTSYQSQSELTLHFGLGSATSIDALEVRWPGGQREKFTASGVNRMLTLVEGTGDKREGEN